MVGGGAAASAAALDVKYLRRHADAPLRDPAVRADFEQPGEEDVYRKIAQDLEGAGLTVSEGEIRRKMDELASVAREQIRNDE